MTLQVEGTNDSSCLSKYSATERGFFSDEYLQHFVTKCPRRAPLIHLGYSVRAAIVNTLIEEFVEYGCSLKQVVSLGAGFDTLYFKLKNKNTHSNFKYYEFDLPRVVERKIKCIQSSYTLKNIIKKFTVNEEGLSSEDYKLLSVDLRDVKAFSGLLQSYGLDPEVPTLFLSECAITSVAVNEEGLSSEDYKLLSVDLRDVKAFSGLLQSYGLDPEVPTLFLSECAITSVAVNEEGLSSEDYKLLSVDLRDVKAFSGLLQSYGLDPEVPTLFLSECAITSVAVNEEGLSSEDYKLLSVDLRDVKAFSGLLQSYGLDPEVPTLFLSECAITSVAVNEEGLSSEDYKLLSVDLRDVKAFSGLLQSYGLDPEVPTLFLSECAITSVAVNEEGLSSEDYKLLSVDLRDVKAFSGLLQSYGLDPEVPTLFLSECAITSVAVNEEGLSSEDYKLLSVDLRDVKAFSGLLQNYGLDPEVPTLFLSECAITSVAVNEEGLSSEDYKLLSVDLRDVKAFSGLLQSYGLDPEVPTLFLSECAITSVAVNEEGLSSEDYKLLSVDLRDVKAFSGLLQSYGLDPEVPTLFLSECAITSVAVNEEGLSSEDYKLLSVDLRDVKAFSGLLQSYGLDPEVPTLFLSECAITYLEEDKSTDLIAFASSLKHVTFVTYEQLHPDDGFGLVMVQHFAYLHSPLMSVERYPTLELQTQRYTQNNWDHCTCLSALEAYNSLMSEEERLRVLCLEPFDEWEELYLKCLHYAVVIASKGSLSNWSRLCRSTVVHQETHQMKDLTWKLAKSKRTCRYGHSIVLSNDQFILIGGFGVRKDATHGRMKDVVWLKRDGSQLNVLKVVEITEFATMYSSWTSLPNGRFILYGGRTSPANCVFQIPQVVTFLPDGSVKSEPLVNSCDRPARWRHSAVIVEREGAEAILVFGGRTSDLQLLNDVWMITLHQNLEDRKVINFVDPSSEKPCPRFSHTASVRSSESRSCEMWVFGGMANIGPMSDVWCLSVASLRWQELAVKGGNIARFGHSASIHGHSLVLVGGVTNCGNGQAPVSVLNLETGVILHYKLPTMSPGRSLLVTNHCHVVSRDEKAIWIIGGGGNCFSFGTFFNSDCAVVQLKDINL